MLRIKKDEPTNDEIDDIKLVISVDDETFDQILEEVASTPSPSLALIHSMQAKAPWE